MADNLTVRVGEGAAPAGGTDTSAKKSKLDQQAEVLGAAIKQRTGRSLDDDVLKAMVLRKQAKAERAEQAERSQKDYQKSTANETLQTRATEDRGLLIGRGREMTTPDGLSQQQRQLVTSDPNAPTILPPATHPPITAEGASAVLEKIFGFMKPASADAAPLTIEHYSETLVPRPPTQPGEKTARDGAQLRDAPTDRPVTGGPATQEPATGRPPTGEQPQRPTDGGQRPVGDNGHPPTTDGTRPPVTTQPGTDGTRPPGTTQPGADGTRPPVTGQPVDTGGRPVVQQPSTDGKLQHPPASNTLHLENQRLPGGQLQTPPPSHSGTTPLGRGVMSGAQATDGSKSTPLGQTAPRGAQTTAGKAPTTGGTRLRATLSPLGSEDSKGSDAPVGRVMRDAGETPTDRPVTGPGTGPVTDDPDEPTQTPTTGRPTTGQVDDDEHPTRPQTGGGSQTTNGRPTTAKDPYKPTLTHDRPAGGTIHLEKQRLPNGQLGTPKPAHSGTTTLDRGVMSGAMATDASGSRPLGQTTTTTTATAGKPATGGRPGGATTVGAPSGGRPSARSAPGQTKGGAATLSLRSGGAQAGRATRATNGTTNTGGGFDTTTSWDGMHFNWEAFFVLFTFKFQEDENEARRLMKELRNAMHKLAQEGIKAKIALEKMNQAFERAEKAFEVGAALKSTIEAASNAAQAQQQQGQQPGGAQPGTPGANTPGSNTPGAQNGAQPNPVQNDGTGTVAPNNGDLSGGQTARPDTANAGGPPRQAQPAGRQATPGAQTPGAQTPGGQTTPGGTQPGAGQQPGANGANPRAAGQQGEQQGGEQGKGGLPGGGLVGNVSDQLRRDLEKINGELIAAAQRGGGEVDARIRSNYMQAQGLFNQMCQLLAMSRSK